MIKIGIEELSTTFTGLLLKYGICHVIFILEMRRTNTMFLIFDKVAVCGWGLWEEIAKILMG